EFLLVDGLAVAVLGALGEEGDLELLVLQAVAEDGDADGEGAVVGAGGVGGGGRVGAGGARAGGGAGGARGGVGWGPWGAGGRRQQLLEGVVAALVALAVGDDDDRLDVAGGRLALHHLHRRAGHVGGAEQPVEQRLLFAARLVLELLVLVVGGRHRQGLLVRLEPGGELLLRPGRAAGG